MEFLVEFLVQLVVEVCCQLIFTGAVDLMAGVAGYKTYQKRAKARKHGEPAPPPDRWWWAFWILLPIALILTTLVVVSLIAQRTS